MEIWRSVVVVGPGLPVNYLAKSLPARQHISRGFMYARTHTCISRYCAAPASYQANNVWLGVLWCDVLFAACRALVLLRENAQHSVPFCRMTRSFNSRHIYTIPHNKYFTTDLIFFSFAAKYIC